MPIASPNRRDFLAGAVRGVAGLSIAQSRSGNIAATPLAENLFLLTGAGANVVARTGPDGVVMVDGGLAERAGSLAQAVAALPGSRPVRTLFNTHWHPEQTGSNLSLARRGAAIVAHENTRLWLTRDKRLPREALPKKTFCDKYAITVDGERIECGYLLQAHTDGDSYVFFPKANVLALGDVISGNGWPSIDWRTGGWINGIAGGLETLLKVANARTRVVPAQGPVLTRADLEAQSEILTIIARRLRTMMFGGRSLDDAIAADPTREYNGEMGDPKQFVRQAFESMWGHFTPGA